jgi:hypothetical protein
VSEAFGDERYCFVCLYPRRTLNIVVNMTTPPNEGTVYDDWLADVGGFDYKLRVGEFSKNRTPYYTGVMVNPYSFSQFLVTEEPSEDLGPNGVASAELETVRTVTIIFFYSELLNG